MAALAYVLSLLGLLSMILASLVKGDKMKKTLFLVFCGKLEQLFFLRSYEKEYFNMLFNFFCWFYFL